MNKGFLLLLILVVPRLILAQSDSSLSIGIKWTTETSWEQVKRKAKAENKYIFLDCFTTWCAPCKKMEKEVYPNDSVGQLINKEFISVKLQMDKTKKDNAFVQAWYNDAAEIEKHYMVNEYPTLLFFSPNGDLVHKEMGFLGISEFISKATTALTSGLKLNDDYAEYQKLIKAYKNGEVNYPRLPFMVTIAKKINDTISRELVRVHADYVTGLSKKERYTRENIEFWATLNLSIKSKSDLLGFFIRDHKLIDKLINKKGYSAQQVDKCIQNFIVAPFIYDNLKDPVAKSGVTKINTATGTQISGTISQDEADWQKLYQLIEKDFGSYYAKRNVLKAKVTWYEKNSNWKNYAITSLDFFKKYPPDFSDWDEGYIKVNSVCWNIFLFVNDKKIIKNSFKHMKKLIDAYPDPSVAGIHFDTYANLLYKLGKKAQAIHWEEIAVSGKWLGYELEVKALEQMKRGEPTYGVQPLTTIK
jgi:thioredoxin-related protein